MEAGFLVSLAPQMSSGTALDSFSIVLSGSSEFFPSDKRGFNHLPKLKGMERCRPTITGV
jgi:hypothetical protein